MSEKSSAIGVAVMHWLKLLFGRSLIVDDGHEPCDECGPGGETEHDGSLPTGTQTF
jgi:hypothetical protein